MCILCGILFELLINEKDERILILYFSIFAKIEKGVNDDEDDDKIIIIHKSKL